MADKIVFSPSDVITPGEHAAAVTLSDSAVLDPTPRAIYVGTGGNLKVTMRGGEVVTFTNLVVGWHPIRPKVLWSTGTTASNIVAIW